MIEIKENICISIPTKSYIYLTELAKQCEVTVKEKIVSVANEQLLQSVIETHGIKELMKPMGNVDKIVIPFHESEGQEINIKKEWFENSGTDSVSLYLSTLLHNYLNLTQDIIEIDKEIREDDISAGKIIPIKIGRDAPIDYNDIPFGQNEPIIKSYIVLPTRTYIVLRNHANGFGDSFENTMISLAMEWDLKPNKSDNTTIDIEDSVTVLLELDDHDVGDIFELTGEFTLTKANQVLEKMLTNIFDLDIAG